MSLNQMVRQESRTRRLRRRLAMICAVAMAAGQASSSFAVPYYLDGNGATAGSGVNTPLTWDAGTNWSTDSTGSIATIIWTDGNEAVFSAGADRVGATSITIAGTVNPAGILTEEGTPTISGGTINLGGDTIQINAGTTAIQSVVSGTGGFTKTGAGILSLGGAGANTYTGKAIVSAGTLAVAGGAGDGTIRGDIDILSGATLRLDVSNRIINTSIINVATGSTFNRNGQGDAIGGLIGGGNVTGGGVLELDFQTGITATFSGSMTGAGLNVRGENQNGNAATRQNLTGTLNTSGGALNIRRGNDATDAVVLELSGAGTSTVGDVFIGLSGAGSAALNIAGTHTLNANSFSIGDQSTHPGTVNQSGGTVNVSGVIRTGHWPNETSTYNLTGGTLNLTGNPGTVVNQNAVAEQNGVMYLGIDGTGNFTVNGASAVANMTALVLDGRGNTTGTDTFTLNAGKVSLGNATNATTLANSGIFAGNLNNNTSYLINVGGGTLSANADWSTILNMTLTGTGGAAVVDTNGRTITIGGTAVGTNAGVLSGAGGLTKTGDGTLILSGANSFAGTVIVNDGVLNIRSNTALGAVGKTVTIAGNASATPNALLPELQLQGNISVAMTTLQTSGSGIAGGGVLRNISGNNTITATNIVLVGGNGGSEWQSDSGLLTINGNIAPNVASRTLVLDGAGNGRINGNISNGTYASPTALPLTKNGLGTWTLAGTNTYTGATIINAGTLNILGSNTGGIFTVNNTGILGGEGTIGGATTAALGSIIAPGDGPGDIGTLTLLSSLDLNGTLLIDINGAGPGNADLLDVGGLLDITGATLDFDLVGVLDDPFYIFASYGSLTGTFANVTGLTASGYEIKYNFQGNNIALVAIPEPATMSLLALGGLAMLRRRRVVC